MRALVHPEQYKGAVIKTINKHSCNVANKTRKSEDSHICCYLPDTHAFQYAQFAATSSLKPFLCKAVLKKSCISLQTGCWPNKVYSIISPHNHEFNSWKTTQSRHRLSLTFLKTTTEDQFSCRAQPITDCTEMLRNNQNLSRCNWMHWFSGKLGNVDFIIF